MLLRLCLEMQCGEETIRELNFNFLPIFWIILFSCRVTIISHFLCDGEENVNFMPKYESFIREVKFGIFLPISDGQ